jgi:hypothetical protein
MQLLEIALNQLTAEHRVQVATAHGIVPNLLHMVSNEARGIDRSRRVTDLCYDAELGKRSKVSLFPAPKIDRRLTFGSWSEQEEDSQDRSRWFVMVMSGKTSADASERSPSTPFGNVDRDDRTLPCRANKVVVSSPNILIYWVPFVQHINTRCLLSFQNHT